MLVADDGHQGPVVLLTFAPDGTIVASAGADGTVRFWRADDATQVAAPLHLQHQATSLAYSPDGTVLAIGDATGGLAVWDASTHVPRWEARQAHARAVQALDFTPDGQRLASGGADGWLRQWSTESGRPTGVDANTGTRGVCLLRYSPDGQHIATGCADGVVDVYQSATAARLLLRSLSTTTADRQ
jgi:WD40 repeat protein